MAMTELPGVPYGDTAPNCPWPQSHTETTGIQPTSLTHAQPLVTSHPHACCLRLSHHASPLPRDAEAIKTLCSVLERKRLHQCRGISIPFLPNLCPNK